jgi:hypothetical protein
MADAQAPNREVRGRFWVEAALFVVSFALLIVTVVWRDWIELVFGVDPDHRDGSLEYLMVLGLLVVASTTFAIARRERRRIDRLRPSVGSA